MHKYWYLAKEAGNYVLYSSKDKKPERHNYGAKNGTPAFEFDSKHWPALRKKYTIDPRYYTAFYNLAVPHPVPDAERPAIESQLIMGILIQNSSAIVIKDDNFATLNMPPSDVIESPAPVKTVQTNTAWPVNDTVPERPFIQPVSATHNQKLASKKFKTPAELVKFINAKVKRENLFSIENLTAYYWTDKKQPRL